MELKVLPLLVRTANGCNRSPHSLALLVVALEQMRDLLRDAACRSLVTSYLPVVDLAVRLLIAHFGNAKYFHLVADCLLAGADDSRLREELSTARSESLLYNKRTLLLRLSGADGGSKATASAKRGALIDKKYAVKLRMLLS